ncbi:MAG: hypothetical protein OEZ09_04165 [Betaproteobacteria bacterium]|nr:hypothetical protein [Betaproteobacteria bacterium]MDH5577629.1 hypothetical protein [Betaproteobacteria bacterium]
MDPDRTYEAFVAAVAERLAARFEQVPTLLTFGIEEALVDWYGHVRIVLRGQVRVLPHEGDLGGEMVWLRGHGTFRGVLWDRMPRSEDWEFLQLARAAFRRCDYEEVLKQYSYVRFSKLLSPAQRKVKEIAARKVDAT